MIDSGAGSGVNVVTQRVMIRSPRSAMWSLCRWVSSSAVRPLAPAPTAVNLCCTPRPQSTRNVCPPARTSVAGPARRASGMGLPVPSSVTSIMGPGIPAVNVRYSRPAESQLRSSNRLPDTAAPAASRASSCSGARSTVSERGFSSTRAARRVPGIGTAATPIASDRYRSQASATCAAVARCCSATAPTTSTAAVRSPRPSSRAGSRRSLRRTPGSAPSRRNRLH